MPNNVINEVTLHGVPLALAKRHICTPEGKVSFEVLLPTPKNFWVHSYSREYQRAFPGVGMEWSTANWGTKWDAYGGPKIDETDDGTVITFQTAWGPPRGWVVALFNTIECEITHWWLSEGGSPTTVERYRRDSAKTAFDPCTWTSEEADEASAEHRRMHMMLWGVEAFDEQGAD